MFAVFTFVINVARRGVRVAPTTFEARTAPPTEGERGNKPNQFLLRATFCPTASQTEQVVEEELLPDNVFVCVRA